ncbi:MAG TPA: hypothetical protein VGN57_16880 [Pirellulaceae bacterium]|nr:hypothetical protein [Pirellulaceae bacterium]
MSGSAIFDSSGVAEALVPLRLTVRGGGCDGRTLTVRSEICVVGSGDDCNLRLDASAPDYVCELVRAADETTVRSRCESARWNGEAFDERLLRPGDCLSVGDVEIIVEEHESPREPAKTFRATARAEARRSARWDGALLVGELRRLQQELQAATGRQASGAESRDLIEQESQLANSLRTLLEAERAETERLNERLNASYRDREELDRRAAELEEALRQATDGLTAATEEQRRLEAELDEQGRERDDASRAEAESLRGMLAEAQDELEQMRRVYDARLQRAEEVAEEERLAAVTRALAEAEERFIGERSRLEEVESQRFIAAESRAVMLEEQANESVERLARVEAEAGERLAAAIEAAVEEAEKRLRAELAATATADLESERTQLEDERAKFLDQRRRWDEERAEYERLAMEQTTLIAEKQRELSEAHDRLAAAANATPQPASEQSFIDVDRQAWEEEKAAFEELARSRMDELAEKTRLVEERLRAAAERQRLEIQREREELAREREEALRAASRPESGLAAYLESDDEELAEPTFAMASAVEEPELADSDALSHDALSHDALSHEESENGDSQNDDSDNEEPRRVGFRFFGDLSAFDASAGGDPQESGELADDLDAIDAVEAERQRQIAEDRLARFAPRPERNEEEEPAVEVDAVANFVEETPSDAPASGFLLRNFLSEGESEGAEVYDAQDESLEIGRATHEETQPSSVAEVLARLGHTIDESDDLSSDSVEGALADEMEPSDLTPSYGGHSFAEPQEIEPAPSFASMPAESEEDSIDDYMQSLLRRVRGESAVQLTQPVQDVRRSTMVRVPEPEPEVEIEEVSVAPLTESEFTPRSEAPEQSDKLSAMRELANESARSAIFSSVVRRTYAKTATTGGLSGAAALLGTLALWFGAESNMLVVGAGLLAWAASAAWGYRAWKNLKELRRLSTPLKKS